MLPAAVFKPLNVYVLNMWPSGWPVVFLLKKSPGLLTASSTRKGIL
jgi:hypothetical protein